MASGFIQVPPDSTGKLIDTDELVVGANTVERHRVRIAGAAATELAAVTSSAGVQVNISSGVVTMSSAQTVNVSSGIITSTAATNPWSSAPGFNVPIVSASSGLIQISGTPTVTATAATSPWSSAPGFNMPVVSASSGLVQISGNIGISSGIVTLSSVHTITATAATNPWSSAPGFNVPIVSASSGQIGTFASTSRQHLVFAFNSSSSNSVSIVTTAPAVLYGWNIGNQTTSGAIGVRIYNTSSGAVGSTAQLTVTIPVPGGSAGAGNNFYVGQGVSCTGGITMAITSNFAATSTGSVAAGDVVGVLYYNT